MGELAKEILPVNIENELKQSYLDYAMSVIVGRALPDVRDGLKPVHRRVLFAMSVLGNDFNKPYKKSARVVGDVIGKYHPHGDTAVYDTIVRMAQPFSMRYMLVDGQGNFGSVDGDSAAAMRYTEIRMDKISHQILADLDKETVDYVPNYDGTEMIPEVMPTRIPNLLVNGSSGIAVGMATNIPPHNLTEVINGCLAIMDNPDIELMELMEHIPGPDFPTAAFINGRAGIVEAYRTGRGRIYLRARHHIETDDKSGKHTLVVTELPYQVNKARLIEKIADLVKEKQLQGISELRDESDKDGMRIVIELRRGEVPEVILNNLYAQTQMQNVFGINVVALVDGQPKTLNLKQLLNAFVRHRREVVTRRTIYELRKARERGHILEGQAVALSNIDPVIALIKASPSSAEAKEKLLAEAWAPGAVMDMLERSGADVCRPDTLEPQYGYRDGKYYLSPEQAQAILDLRLHRLTGLEQEKLVAEYKELIDRITGLLEILESRERLMQVIREELEEVKEQFGDERRTEIMHSQQDLTLEDLITEEDMVVTLSHGGYAKTQPVDTYQAQRRGGKGKMAAAVKDEDFVEHILVASTHDTILCFSNRGKVYWLKVYQIPVASRTAKGRPMVNLLPLAEDERITTVLPVHEYTENHFIFMATASGTVKKTALMNFARQRSSGLIAVDLNEDDTLIGAAITDGNKDIMLCSNSGKAVRFNEADVRPMGRTARGVRGIRLKGGQRVISLIIPEENVRVLCVSAKGYGKRTDMEEFPVHNRGGSGVIAMQTSKRNGELVGAVPVVDGDEIMLISNKGTLVRTRTDEISVLGRNTQGVTLIKVSADEKLVGVERIEEPEEDENAAEGVVSDDANATE
ncbi:MAG: DNA gyrase subunit A [Pseudomonadales bacterium]|nr:DNA gyrase subunit A [Pseudomonadales bacterium]MCP5302674.1 DNA gyrase subunit A [Pseudomonadales bacterium]